MKNEAYLFDTSALLAYIENEDGADIMTLNHPLDTPAPED
jgi:PIN domain nuclease of toxin-antitoxin system